MCSLLQVPVAVTYLTSLRSCNYYHLVVHPLTDLNLVQLGVVWTLYHLQKWYACNINTAFC